MKENDLVNRIKDSPRTEKALNRRENGKISPVKRSHQLEILYKPS